MLLSEALGAARSNQRNLSAHFSRSGVLKGVYAVRHAHLLAQRPELVRVDKAPYPFHVVPVCDDAVFHGVLDLRLRRGSQACSKLSGARPEYQPALVGLTFSNPRSSCAFRPMKRSPSTAPAMTRGCFGRPTLCTEFREGDSNTAISAFQPSGAFAHMCVPPGPVARPTRARAGSCSAGLARALFTHKEGKKHFG